MKTYLVGGAVRDKLLGEPVTERDWVVTEATPEHLLSLGYQQVGKDFPVFLHPETKEEYALARTERKTAPGYTGFSVYAAPDVTLEEDLKRRDLTINAMAEAEDGSLIDPFNGHADLHNGLLRHVSPAFTEDPVRILRVARFAARFARFQVAEETNRLMQSMVAAGEVDALVPERVWKELFRALGEARPDKFFRVLEDCGALARIFPELTRITSRRFETVVRLSSDPAVRFAALLAPLGEETSEKGWQAVQSLCERLRVPADYRELAELAMRYPAFTHRPFSAESVLAFLERCDAFRRPQRFHHLLEVCEVLTPQADWPARLAAAYQKTAAVQAQAVVAQGVKGAAIRDELRRLRLAALG